MRIIVTGATGFVGRALLERLLEENYDVVAATRHPIELPVPTDVIGEIDSTTDWAHTLQGADCVIHLAARVHRLSETETDPLPGYRETNTHGTVRLAQAAADAGVKRLVFLSTAKVLGEASSVVGFSDATEPAPRDAYSISKWEAEQALIDFSRTTGLEICVLRPPLVYGPGVRANFLRLMRLVDRGYPLPFGAVQNRRSMVALDNLVSAIALCATHPGAAGQTFLASDDEALSTPELIRRLAVRLNKPARLLSVPPALLRWLGRLTGRSAEIDRLLGNFVVDSGRIRSVLGWRAPISIDEALDETVSWYFRQDAKR